MTPSRKPAGQICPSCGRRFTPEKEGHRYCKAACRYAGPKPSEEWCDWDAVDRLFDPARDPEEKCRRDDWLLIARGIPEENRQTWIWLHAHETVGQRRIHFQRAEANGAPL